MTHALIRSAALSPVQVDDMLNVKLPAKTVHLRPRKAAPPAPSRATTSALVQLGTTLQALGAQLVNSVVDCAV